MGKKRTRVPQALPESLKLAQERFEEWRRTRTQRKIPDRLWRLAVIQAGQHGCTKTAVALRLHRHALKTRSDSDAAAKTSKTRARGFVSLGTVAALPKPTNSGHGSVEVEVAGGRIRIEWTGESPVDLIAFGQRLLGGER